MRVLSLSRPWPWAFLHAGKGLENRKRKDGRMPAICSHRGPLLLHAAQSWDKEAIGWMLERGLLGGDSARRIREQRIHPAGVIFARCMAIAHIDPDGQLWLNPEGAEDEPELLASLDMRWWMGGYALVLADVQPTKWVPCRGALGLWTPPPDVLAQLEAAP